MKFNATLLTVLLAFSFNTIFSQENQTDETKSIKGKKGQFFIYQGWHESGYTKSDMHFKGEGFDFILHDVVATDRVAPYGLYPYLSPTHFTETQTSTRIGYYFKDNYSVSFGIDHLKYVMSFGQTVKIDGTLNTGTNYDKVYVNEDIVMKRDFLEFEHTNGLNLLNIELNRVDDLLKIMKVTSKHFELNLIEGVGAGVLMPHTEVSLVNKPRFEAFNLAGYGFSCKVGLNFTFVKHFFIQAELKGNYMNMPRARISANKNEKVSQSFFAYQKVLVFGGNFRLWK